MSGTFKREKCGRQYDSDVCPDCNYEASVKEFDSNSLQKCLKPRTHTCTFVELGDALKGAVKVKALTLDDCELIIDQMYSTRASKLSDSVWELCWEDVTNAAGDTESALRKFYLHYLDYEFKSYGPRRLLLDTSAWEDATYYLTTFLPELKEIR